MLNIHIPTIVFQIINFIILAVALYFLLFRSVTKTIKKRADQKEQMLKEIEQNEAESKKVLAEYNQKLEDVNKEVEVIVNKARLQLENDRKAIMLDVEAEAQQKLNTANEEMAHHQELATQQFFSKVLDQVIETSRTVIIKSIPPGLHVQLVQQLADEIWRLGREDLHRVAAIRNSLKERTPIVFVETAAALTTEEQGLLIRTFSALADRNIKLEIKVTPELSAGCRVRISDLVVDHSIEARLMQIKDTAAEELQRKFAPEPLK